MKNKFYVIILLILTGITITTSFIPSNNITEIEGRNNLEKHSNLAHPEAGHIESIDN